MKVNIIAEAGVNHNGSIAKAKKLALEAKKTGADFVNAPDGIEFSDVRAQINFNWSWGAVSLKKDYSEWGNGYFGNVILSDKAPSYPHLYMELKPVDFNYLMNIITDKNLLIN